MQDHLIVVVFTHQIFLEYLLLSVIVKLIFYLSANSSIAIT